MHICLCFDNNFVSFAAILIFSILKNNPSTNIQFHIISQDLTEKSKNIINKLINQKIKIIFYSLTDKSLDSFPMDDGSYLSKATYYRLFIPKLLPQNISKVIYIDSDMLNVGNLKELWDTNIDKYALAGVCDIGADDIRIYNRLLYPPSFGYFNAGLLLLNLDYIRDNSLFNSCFKFLNEHQTTIKMHDQDVLNASLYGKTLWLPATYNVMITLYRKEPPLLAEETRLKLLSEYKNPIIIHYTGTIKPWNYEYQIDKLPFGELWLQYKKQSGIKIKKTFASKKNKVVCLKYVAKKILSSINIYHKKNIEFYDTSEIENNLLKNIKEYS